MADTFLAYIDEAADEQNNLCVFTALLIPVHEWRIAFEELKKLRKELEASDHLYPGGEWHARDFLTGRGYISPKTNPVGKARRAEIFKKILYWIAEMPNMSVINALYPLRDGAHIQLLDTLEALVLGINRTMQARDAYAMLICDEGHDKAYRNVVRALAEAGRAERIVEDAVLQIVRALVLHPTYGLLRLRAAAP